MPRKDGAGGGMSSIPKVAGPLWMQTLRGELLGRKVALVCCGEAHEDCIDLTRNNSVPLPELVLQRDDTAGGAVAIPKQRWLGQKKGVTIDQARNWATHVLSSWDEFDCEQAALVFTTTKTNRAGKPVGTAFVGTVDRDACPGALQGELPPGTAVFLLNDADAEAAQYQDLRLSGHEVADDDLDALIATRKRRLLEESNTELFDDWLLRSAEPGGGPAKPALRVVLEGAVTPDEVELHVDPQIGEPPIADPRIRAIDIDSDTDSEDDYDPDDGTGTYLTYLQRQLEAAPALRGCIQTIDPRILGDAEDDKTTAAFQSLQVGGPPPDAELAALASEIGDTETSGISDSPTSAVVGTGSQDGAETTGTNAPKTPKTDRSKKGRIKSEEQDPMPVPSWEAYFGASGDLLYYSPHVKADYAQLFAHCVRTPAALRAFFHELYFGTVNAAVAKLQLSPDTRPLAHIRSAIYQPTPDAPIVPRGNAGGEVPVKAAPINRYLKAKGSDPPRLWVSGLVDSVERAGLGGLVQRARQWFETAVNSLLDDPKSDPEGDYFKAWLRECHPEIYKDVDISDPAAFRRRRWAPSDTGHHKYDMNKITIPGVTDAFKEFAALAKDGRVSNKRERVLAQIIVDSYQLRMVDLASILAIAQAVVAAAAEGERCVVVYYGGADHATSLVDFWESEGWVKTGMVGKDEWGDREPRGLKLPAYLRSLDALFPAKWDRLQPKVSAGAVGASASGDTDETPAASAPGAGPKCAACQLCKPRREFNNAQLKKPATKRRCRKCIEGAIQ